MAANNSNSIPKHLESYLGKIAEGWGDDSQMHGIHVVCFHDQPEPGVTTFATLGLSEFELTLPKGRTIRQELVVCSEDSTSEKEVAAFLLSLAEHILGRKRALLRGEVLGPSVPVIRGATVTAVYATNPSPFPDGFSPFNGSEPPTIFVFLVPLTSQEAELIAKMGWGWFEDALEQQDPNIWSFIRTDEVLLRQS